VAGLLFVISPRFLSKRETSLLDAPKEKKNLILERESLRAFHEKAEECQVIESMRLNVGHGRK